MSGANSRRGESFSDHLLTYMATLDSLTRRSPPALELIRIPLDKGEQGERLIYGTPRMMTWLRTDLDNLVQGRLKAADTPKEQLYIWLRRWITGRPIRYDTMFKDLTPMKDEIWEGKTVDLRIFGWMYRPLIFIASLPAYADLYKGKNATKSYSVARDMVKTERNSIDLDEPKYETGTFDYLVRT
jgi:hypothetical protein